MHDFKIKQVHSSTKPVCKTKWNLEISNDQRKVFGTKVVKFASLSFFPYKLIGYFNQALESDWLFCCNAALIS